MKSFLRCCGFCFLGIFGFLAFFFCWGILDALMAPDKTHHQKLTIRQQLVLTTSPADICALLDLEGADAQSVVKRLCAFDTAEADAMLVGASHMSTAALAALEQQVASDRQRFLPVLIREVTARPETDHSGRLMNVLTRTGGVDGERVLEQLLTHDEPFGRYQAYKALMCFGREETVRRLVAAKGNDERLADLARLGGRRLEYGHPLCLRIHELIEGKFMSRDEHLIAMARRNPGFTDDVLRRLLQEEDRYVQTACIRLLLERKTDDAFDHYLRGMQDHPTRRQQLIDAYRAVAAELGPLLLQRFRTSTNDYERYEALRGIIIGKHPKGFPLAKRLAREERSEYANAVKRLMVVHYGEENVAYFRGLVEDERMRACALEVLAKFGSRQDLVHFSALRNHEDLKLRCLAYVGYGTVATAKEQEDVLLQGLQDEHFRVAFASATNMTRTTAPRIRVQLRTLARTGRHLHQRLLAAEVLGRGREWQDLPLLVDVLGQDFQQLDDNEVVATTISLGGYWLVKKFFASSLESDCGKARLTLARHMETMTGQQFGTDHSAWKQWLAKGSHERHD